MLFLSEKNGRKWLIFIAIMAMQTNPTRKEILPLAEYLRLKLL